MDVTRNLENVADDDEKFVHAEVDRLFDPSSLSNGEEPRLALIIGAVAAGKTTLRRERFATGFVLIDAADIFVSLQGEALLAFPGPLEEAMERVGKAAATRAIAERRHIVTELIGEDREATEALCHAMDGAGYSIGMLGLTCDLDVALERNLGRGENNVSAYYAEPYHRRWLTQAALAARHNELRLAG